MKDIFCDTNFRIIQKLASGGMGDVFLAEWQGAVGFRKTVAIKTVRRNLLKDRRTKAMFIGEAKLVSDLIHENILQIYQLGQYENGYYIVMEAVFGLDLGDLIQTHRDRKLAMPVELAAFIVSRVARALHYAHNKRDHDGKPLNIVHRDVTPHNVMINYGGVVKLTDFGIAKALTHPTPDETTTLMGKFPYMSPEQVMFQGTDARSDIFSLGLVAFELLTGRMVYKVSDADTLLDKMERFRIPHVKKINPAVPDVLDSIVMRSLKLDPEKRFSDAKKMGAALEHYMYDKGFGPTNEKLAAYIAEIDPQAKDKAYW
jgi:serine/threonine-protein kinase